VPEIARIVEEGGIAIQASFLKENPIKVDKWTAADSGTGEKAKR